MVRISLKEAYDDRSVIKKIADLEANKQDKLTAGQGVSIDNNVINVDTSSLATKAALSAESAKLDKKIDTQSARLDARIDASNVNIKSNADAILTIETELGSDALQGTIYYRISKVEGDVITLKPLVDGSIRSVNVEGDGSTVYHKALHNNGIVETDAIPVASETKAGVMSAGMYVGFNGSIQNLQARMSVLEGVGITYQLTGLSDTPSDAEITAAFQAQYPNVPLSAGIRAADYPKAKIWQYSGTNWIQLTSININVATSTALGLVKGSATSEANKGRIFVEIDGSMTVIGWDTLNALVSSTKQSLDNLEPKVTTQGNQITALEEDVATNAADIVTLKGTSANHESRISSLETTSSDLRTRMGTAENDIDTLQASDSQQTSKISALEADMNNVKPRVGQLESDVGALETKVNQHTQSISDITTEVNGLKTSKQDKLIAGEGIAIADDGKTISAQYTPVQRSLTVRSEIENEIKRFFQSSSAGESITILAEGGEVNMQSGYANSQYLTKIRWTGGSGAFFDIAPYTPLKCMGTFVDSFGQKCKIIESDYCYVGWDDYDARVGATVITLKDCDSTYPSLAIYVNGEKAGKNDNSYGLVTFRFIISNVSEENLLLMTNY